MHVAFELSRHKMKPRAKAVCGGIHVVFSALQLLARKTAEDEKKEEDRHRFVAMKLSLSAAQQTPSAVPFSDRSKPSFATLLAGRQAEGQPNQEIRPRE